MKISTRGRYGVRAIIYLASSYYNRPVSIKTIAENESISAEFLEQIFFKLKKASLINSIRGPGGGFVLNKKTSEISIKDILDAVGESIAPSPCTNNKKTCSRNDTCPASQVWNGLNTLAENYLSRVTIKDILEKNSQKYYDRLNPDENFSI